MEMNHRISAEIRNLFKFIFSFHAQLFFPKQMKKCLALLLIVSIYGRVHYNVIYLCRLSWSLSHDSYDFQIQL